LHRKGVTTEAEVLSSRKRSGGDGATEYRTELRYVDVNGHNVSVTKPLLNFHGRGEKITVVYDPGNPTRMELAEAVERSKPDGGLFALGRSRWIPVLLFVIPGVLMILFPFGDPICDDPTFRDMAFCVEAGK
jgi:hypothetical protein